MSINIIQWNINGYIKKLNDIKIIIQNHNPTIICLQETNLNGNFNPHINNFNTYTTNRTDYVRHSGGVAILAHSEYPSSRVSVQSTLEMVTIYFQLETKITLCSIYIPNQNQFDASDIENIIQQLPTPFLLTGDFNSHSTYWGSDKTDDRGKQIEKITEVDNITLLHNGEPTRINPTHGKFSTIDLSLCSASLAQRINWSTLPEIYGSDHIPIKIDLLSSKASLNKLPSRWKLKNTDWNLFSQMVEIYLNSNPPPPDDPISNDVSHITNSIITAANLLIGKTKNSKVPWWNPEIKLSIKNKNKALKVFIKTGNIDDHILLKQLRAKTRYLVKRSKENSWKLFTSTIGLNSDPSLVWTKVRSLRGHNKEKELHIIKDNTIHINPTEVANLIGNIFYANSSDINYDETFINMTNTSDYREFQSNINPTDQKQKYLNSTISLKELN
jgi:exonuclease III